MKLKKYTGPIILLCLYAGAVYFLRDNKALQLITTIIMAVVISVWTSVIRLNGRK